MLFSIITINYNNEKGLRKTLDSILSQTCRDFEWIVIDGGSSDGSRELIEQYQSSIAYWCSEPDRGLYNAMNKGVLKANGEYCLFLNSGDVLCDSRVIEMLYSCSLCADIVSGDIYIDEIKKSKLRKSVDRVNAFWLYDNSLYHPSTWIRRDVIARYPYHENYRTISDWIFFFEALVLHNCTYHHINIPISVFYKDGISNSMKYKDIAIGDKMNFLKNYFPAKYIEDKKDIQSYHYMSYGMSHLTNGGKVLMSFLYRVVAYIDLHLFKSLSHLF